MLRLPEGAEIEIAQCEECVKYFASHDYLIEHYKRKHPDKYIREVRAKEEQIKMRELGEIKHKAQAAAQEDDFFSKVKEDILDKFSNNFVDL